MVEKAVVISNETGLHARPASLFVSFVKKYGCDIRLVKDDKALDAKSILNVMSLGLRKGAEITLRAEGEGEQEALDEVVAFLAELKD